MKTVITDDAIVVSIMAVNNEIGSVMDVPALAEVAHRHGALFHTDATQAWGKVPLSVKDWHVDALSVSSHKIGGPKGIGALYLKTRTPFSVQIVGGGQESKRRSGTQNVCGVVGFAAAADRLRLHGSEEASKMRELRDYCYEGLLRHKGVKQVFHASRGQQLLLHISSMSWLMGLKVKRSFFSSIDAVSVFRVVRHARLILLIHPTY